MRIRSGALCSLITASIMLLAGGRGFTAEDPPAALAFYLGKKDASILLIDGTANKITNTTYQRGLSTEDPRKKGRWLRQGMHYFLHENGKVREEIPYTDDKIEGVKRTFDSKGRKQTETAYVGGLKNGLMTTYWANDLVSGTTNYKDDRRHGKSTDMQMYGGESVKSFEKNFVDGLEHGEKLQYSGDGKKVIVRSVYERGKCISKTDLK